MQVPVVLDRSSGETLTGQIVEQLRRAITHARLPVGTRMPSSRQLSEQLAVARNTVVRAYEILMTEGLVDSRPASGIFVSAPDPGCAPPVPTAPQGVREPSWSMPLPSLPVRLVQRSGTIRRRLSFDFYPGRSHHALFPLKLWRRHLAKNLTFGGARGLTEGGEAAGLLALRSAIALYIATTRGIAADPSRIIIVSGVQEGISLASRLFLHRGTLAALEDPGSQGALYAFEATGSETVGVAVDQDGLVPSDLPLRSTALLYVTPSHQFPTGVMLSAGRRDSIAAWARRCGCYILEDDSDADLRFEGSNPPAIAADAPDCTIYLGSFARTLGAGLGLGFMVVPPRLAEVVVAAKELLDGGNAWLDQATLADMMAGNSYAVHVARVRAHYRENRDRLLAALRRSFGEVSISGETGGLHLLWNLPAGVPDAAVVENLARRSRIGVYPLASCGAMTIRPSLLDRRALLLGFGALLPKQIEQAMDRLSEAIDDTVDDLKTDVTTYLVEAPQGSVQLPGRARRTPMHLDSRFRQQPALPKPRRARAPSKTRIAQGPGLTMASVSSIYRYPIKGLSAQPLAQVDTEAGRPIPYDRVFALARPTAPLDRDDPKWAKKGLFAMLMLDEGLAQVATSLDIDTMWLTAWRAGRQVAAGCLTDPAQREQLERFFWTLLPSFKDPPVLIRSRVGHFMDKPDSVISLINLATLRSLEERWGVSLDPLRFRANIYIDGAKAFEEVDWVGSEVTIGGTTFLVDRVNGRCGATNVNPATARRDLDIPTSLRASFGHKNLGVYLIARQNGTIAVGDTVLASGSIEYVAAPPARSPEPEGPRRQFICRGCYYIYDESAGVPQQGIPPGTALMALPTDWRCPDCGSEKVLFVPQVHDGS
ncbi:aminotransferase class I/II-fold pyridoxal phosphate-dependent enzyme [Lichenihabitans psoromatis]|uniref:MocR-like pyridoxine biosynthesis transcription factor PdxR n=1 Tax=Lichenihabitans psoromatis TaxID=2528642 RepID=UPI001036404D|nr:aminotransferase class I/II-fold pyridoxal phosphate-dependent enzyme [Lichenihabitans psoromatis]